MNTSDKIDAFLLNFNYHLDKDIIDEIQRDFGCRLHVYNVAMGGIDDDTYTTAILLLNRVPKNFITQEYLIVNLPSWSALAVYIINEITARTSRLPHILEISNINNCVKFNRIRNLALEKHNTINHMRR
jgi:hypothetical protein